MSFKFTQPVDYATFWTRIRFRNLKTGELIDQGLFGNKRFEADDITITADAVGSDGLEVVPELYDSEFRILKQETLSPTVLEETGLRLSLRCMTRKFES